MSDQVPSALEQDNSEARVLLWYLEISRIMSLLPSAVAGR